MGEFPYLVYKCRRNMRIDTRQLKNTEINILKSHFLLKFNVLHFLFSPLFASKVSAAEIHRHDSRQKRNKEPQNTNFYHLIFFPFYCKTRNKKKEKFSCIMLEWIQNSSPSREIADRYK